MKREGHFLRKSPEKGINARKMHFHPLLCRVAASSLGQLDRGPQPAIRCTMGHMVGVAITMDDLLLVYRVMQTRCRMRVSVIFGKNMRGASPLTTIYEPPKVQRTS